MKTWLEINTTSGIQKRAVKPNGETGIASGACPNPECKADPFLVVGGNLRRMADNRTNKSDGRCRACGDAVGYIYHHPDTIFGIEEDERVLNGRCRVY